MWIKGEAVWNKPGIAVGTVGELRTTACHLLYWRAVYDTGYVVILGPLSRNAILGSCLATYVESSPEF